MGISKKIRFEIFKRDGFKCAYCGKAPPVVTLELDHIEPKAKGGKEPAQLQENLEILKEKELQLSEYRKFIAKIEKRLKGDFEEISGIYSEYYPGWEFSDRFKNVSLRRFLQLLPKHLVIESLLIAVSRWPNNKDKVIPYFCDICWNKIKGTER